MTRLILAFAFFSLTQFEVYAQSESIRKPDYLAVQTGLTLDKYNSLGIRAFFEYQKEFRNKLQYGISFEQCAHFGRGATDQRDELSTSLSLMSFNCYYRLNLIKDRIFWNSGLGVGGVHVNWEDHDKVGLTVNLSSTLNIKMTKRIYMETSPLSILIPSNRLYFSTMDVVNYTDFYAFTLLPIGIKVKL